jgi:hypothetical protein
LQESAFRLRRRHRRRGEKYPEGFGSRLVKTLLDGFNAMKHDDALLEVVDLVLYFQGLTKKDAKKEEKK